MVKAFITVLIWSSFIYGSLPTKIQEFISKDKIKAENLSIYIAETKSGKVVAK